MAAENNEENMENESLETLLDSAAKNGQLTFLKRLNRRREELMEMEIPLKEPNAATKSGRLHNKLVQSAQLPTFYRNEEGRKFIAFLYGLIDTGILNSALRNVLAKGNRNLADQCGDVIMRVWKSVLIDEKKREEMDTFIQDVIRMSILSKQSSLAAASRHAIKRIALHKQQRAVESMLGKAVRPLLWRFLECPNMLVRHNAAQLLFVLFPVREDDLPVEERLELFQMQYNFFKKLLEDPCATVRMAAVRGVCNVLCTYWTLSPTDELKSTLVTLVDRSSKDSASVQERHAVFQGLKQLLSCAAAVDVLKKLLPKVIRFGLNDRSERVRLGAVEVLVAMRPHKYLNFWEAVKLDGDLIPRLGVETCPRVAKKLVELLFNSFCPKGLKVSDDQKLLRIITLVNKNVSAARIFHRYAYKYLGPDEAVENIIRILRFVHQRVREETKGKEEIDENDYDSSSSDMTESVKKMRETSSSGTGTAIDYSARNEYLVGSLLDCAAILWASARFDLFANNIDTARAKLHKVGGRVLYRLLNFYTQGPVSEVVVYMCSLLPEAHMKYLSKSVLNKLTTGQIDRKDDRVMLEAACAWHFEDLLKIICLWFKNGFQSTHQSKHSLNESINGRPKRRRVQFIEEESSPGSPVNALRYLSSLMSIPSVPDRLVTECSHLLPQLLESFQKAKIFVEEYLKMEREKDGLVEQEPTAEGTAPQLPLSFPDLVICLKMHISLTVLIASKSETNKEEKMPLLVAYVDWLRDNIVDRIADLEAVRLLKDVQLLSEGVLAGFSYALLAGVRSDDFEEAVSNILLDFFDKDESSVLLSSLLETLHHLNESIIHWGGQNKERRIVELIIPLLECLIRFFVQLLGAAKDTTDDPIVEICAKASKRFQELLVSVCCRDVSVTRSGPASRLMLVLTIAVINSFDSSIEKNGVIENPTDSSFEWPALADFLLRKVVLKSALLTREMSTQLSSMADQEILVQRDNDRPFGRAGGAIQLLLMLAVGKRVRTVLVRARDRIREQIVQLDDTLMGQELCTEALSLLDRRLSIA